MGYASSSVDLARVNIFLAWALDDMLTSGYYDTVDTNTPDRYSGALTMTTAALAPAAAAQAAALVANALAALPSALNPAIAPVRAMMVRRAAGLLPTAGLAPIPAAGIETDAELAAEAAAAADGLDRIAALLAEGKEEQAWELSALVADDLIRLDHILGTLAA